MMSVDGELGRDVRGILRKVLMFVVMFLFIGVLVQMCSSYMSHRADHITLKEQSLAYKREFCQNYELRAKIGIAYDKCAGASAILKQNSDFEAFVKMFVEWRICGKSGCSNIAISPIRLFSWLFGSLGVLILVFAGALVAFLIRGVYGNFRTRTELPISMPCVHSKVA